MNNERLADLFIDQGLMDRAQADDVLLETSQNGKAIDQAMVDHGIVDEHQFYLAIADALGTEVVDLGEIEFTPRILHLIPAGLARLHRALPIGERDNGIRFALVDPLDTQTIEDLRFALGRDIQVVLAPSLEIEERLRKHYGEDTSSMEDILKQLGETGELMTLAGDKAVGPNVEAEANVTPIIRFVDLILYQAIQNLASDIHFEPFEDEFKVRYRVDGALYEMAPPPRHLALPVISAPLICASRLCQRNSAKASSYACSIARSSISIWKASGCPITSCNTSSR
jgi:type IV pilus assembly protein PilB